MTVSDGTARYARIHDGTADAARAIAVPTRACCMLHVVSWLVCCMLYVASDGRWLDLHSDSIARRQSWYSIAWCAAHNKHTTKLVPVRDEQTKQPKPPPVVLMALVAAAAAAAAVADRLSWLGSARLGSRTPPRCGVCVNRYLGHW